jgi:hypothetical protein
LPPKQRWSFVPAQTEQQRHGGGIYTDFEHEPARMLTRSWPNESAECSDLNLDGV